MSRKFGSLTLVAAGPRTLLLGAVVSALVLALIFLDQILVQNFAREDSFTILDPIAIGPVSAIEPLVNTHHRRWQAAPVSPGRASQLLSYGLKAMRPLEPSTRNLSHYTCVAYDVEWLEQHSQDNMIKATGAVRTCKNHVVVPSSVETCCRLVGEFPDVLCAGFTRNATVCDGYPCKTAVVAIEKSHHRYWTLDPMCQGACHDGVDLFRFENRRDSSHMTFRSESDALENFIADTLVCQLFQEYADATGKRDCELPASGAASSEKDDESQHFLQTSPGTNALSLNDDTVSSSQSRNEPGNAISKYDADSEANWKATGRLIRAETTWPGRCSLDPNFGVQFLTPLCDPLDLALTEDVGRTSGMYAGVTGEISLSSLSATVPIPRRSEFSNKEEEVRSGRQVEVGSRAPEMDDDYEYGFRNVEHNEHDKDDRDDRLAGPNQPPVPILRWEARFVSGGGTGFWHADLFNIDSRGRIWLAQVTMPWNDIAAQHAWWDVLALGLARQREAPSLMSGNTVIDARNFALGWH